jgi:hypothetical protein
MKSFPIKIRFVGYKIHQRLITPISRSIEFADKSPNKINDKTQLQRLGCLNNVVNFFPNLRSIRQPLYKHLRKNPLVWTFQMTEIIRSLKNRVKSLLRFRIPYSNAFLIIEIDASNIGYIGILRTKKPRTLNK